nr:hypothetical protein [Tanacetum cinerariifolium]
WKQWKHILKQNQGDVNNAMGSKKKIVMVTSDPLALIVEKTNVSKSKEKAVVSSDSEGNYDKSDVDHNDSEEKDQLVDKLIRKFNKKIVKC